MNKKSYAGRKPNTQNMRACYTLFAAGKNYSQASKELGLPRPTCYGYYKKFEALWPQGDKLSILIGKDEPRILYGLMRDRIIDRVPFDEKNCKRYVNLSITTYTIRDTKGTEYLILDFEAFKAKLSVFGIGFSELFKTMNKMRRFVIVFGIAYDIENPPTMKDLRRLQQK